MYAKIDSYSFRSRSSLLAVCTTYNSIGTWRDDVARKESSNNVVRVTDAVSGQTLYATPHTQI